MGIEATFCIGIGHRISVELYRLCSYGHYIAHRYPSTLHLLEDSPGLPANSQLKKGKIVKKANGVIGEFVYTT